MILIDEEAFEVFKQATSNLIANAIKNKHQTTLSTLEEKYRHIPNVSIFKSKSFPNPNIENLIEKTLDKKADENKPNITNNGGNDKMTLLEVKGLVLGKKKRKDGRFLGRYKIDGVYHSFYARSFDELQAVALDVISGKKTPKKTHILTYKEWSEQWLKMYHKNKTNEATFKKDCGVFKNHILPHLADKPLNKITGFDIQSTINACPFSRQRQVVADKLIASLKKAYEIDLLKKDITKAAEKPSHEGKEGRALTGLEEKKLLVELKGNELELYIIFLLYSGLRRNEGLGIEWRHLNFEEETISVEQQVTMKNTITIKLKTKTSKRIVKMFPIIKKILQPLSAGKNPNERVFTHAPDFVSRAFPDFCNEIGLTGITIKDTRTTFGTRCEKMGISSKVVQAWMGHSKLDTTVNTYQKVDDELIAKAFEKVKVHFDSYFDSYSTDSDKKTKHKGKKQ